MLLLNSLHPLPEGRGFSLGLDKKYILNFPFTFFD